MDEEIEYKEIGREKKVRKKKHYLVRFLIIVGVIAALIVFITSSFFDIKHIDVTGNSYYTDEEVINMANVTKGKNIFFQAGKSEIKDRLSANSYFSDIKVSRKLPNTLVIHVTERKQVAALVYGNKYVVIDVNGRVLRITEVEPEVTVLKGLTLSKMEVGEKVKAVEKQTLSTTLKMINSMAKELFGPETRTKFRPHHFPFTEPSAEMDVSCFKCGGKGCNVCKGSGWIEILGCGMTHPHVHQVGGIDTEKYTGFAVGMGVERIAMLKYGIDDIRLLFENDMRFIDQFK